MIRTILVVLLVTLFLIFTTPFRFLLTKINGDSTKTETLLLHMAQRIFQAVLFLSGTEVIIKGKENIPDDTAVLFVSNHRGFFDIVVGYCQVKGPCSFIAKKELEKIPLLSSYMDALHCLFLDRENPREGLKTILTAIDLAKNGHSIWVCPEGTRSKTKEMLPFHEGSLKIASKANCPIIPVAITGTDDVLENHFPFIRPTKVTITFGKPIIANTLPRPEQKALGNYTQNIIKNMLEEE